MERRELKALLRESGCARESGGFTFLCDPDWMPAEVAQAEAAMAHAATLPAAASERGWLCVRTGGTGGAIKFARHDEQTIGAAVKGYCDHFGLYPARAYGVLPLYHVSGLMAWLRCMLTGGEYRPCEWKKLEMGETPGRFEGDWVISLVPTQLQRLIMRPRCADWLRDFRVVFLGGGPAWKDLIELASLAGLPISLTYGMTETAAMVTASRPVDFRAGWRGSGTAMPHVRVTLDDEGLIRVRGESVFRGYFPEWRETREYITGDFGRIDQNGHLQVLGRRSSMIITGGKKVFPEDVEAVLLASGQFEDVAVIGVPQSEWGEMVVACYQPGRRPPKLERATRDLAAHQRPKHFIPVADWPRNAQGKLNRASLLAAAKSHLR